MTSRKSSADAGRAGDQVELLRDHDAEVVGEHVRPELRLPGRVSRTGLVLPDGLRIETWRRVGTFLGRVEASMHWLIGDWLLFGERSYGEKYAQGEDDVGLDPGTLSNLCAVCQRFELPRRRGNLSFSHHAVVAYLPPDIADRLLDLAEEHGWTRAELRRQVRALRERSAAVEVAQQRLKEAEGQLTASQNRLDNSNDAASMSHLRRMVRSAERAVERARADFDRALDEQESEREVDVVHAPVWRCRGCGCAWPCPAASETERALAVDLTSARHALGESLHVVDDPDAEQ